MSGSIMANLTYTLSHQTVIETIQILIPVESDVPVPCSMFVFQLEEC